MDKPGLAVIIAQKLAKKKGQDMPDDDMSGPTDEHLQMISDDLVKAFEAKDSTAIKELLSEFFQACDSAPHMEASSEDN